MEVNLKYLDKAIDKWLKLNIEKAPIKELRIKYLHEKYSNFVDTINANKLSTIHKEKEGNNETIIKPALIKFLNTIYNYYKIGEFEIVESKLNSDNLIIDFFPEEIKAKYKNHDFLKNENIYTPPTFEFIDESEKKQFFKFIKSTIALFEIKRKLENLYPEILLINSSNNDPIIVKLNEDNPINRFNNKMPLEFARKHFHVFVTDIAKNKNEPFLTQSQFDNFIEKAFLKNTKIQKQHFNLNGSQKGFIVKRFWQFYYEALKSKFELSANCIDKYIHLLFDNFDNEEFNDFKNLKNNFSDKSKKNWDDL